MTVEVNYQNGEIAIGENDTHATPPAGKIKLYAKTDGSLYSKNPSGTESALGSGGGGGALSALTAATASNTINSGDNPQTWNWSLTTDSISAINFGENVASSGGTPDTGNNTQSLVSITNLATSTANLFYVKRGYDASHLFKLSSGGRIELIAGDDGDGDPTGNQNGTPVIIRGGNSLTTDRVGGYISITGGDASIGNNTGGQINITGGVGHGGNDGGSANLFGGEAGATGSGGNVTLQGGYGGATSGAGGSVFLVGFDAQTSGDGGSVNLTGGNAIGGTFGAINLTAKNFVSFTSGNFQADTFPGNAIAKQYVVRTETTNATSTEMFIDGTGGTLRMVIPSDATWKFECHVVARRADADNVSAGYQYAGVIDNNGGTTALVGTIQQIMTPQEDNAAYAVTITADDTHDALVISVNGVAGSTVHWVAFVTIVEASG